MREITVVVGDAVELGISTTREVLDEIARAGALQQWAEIVVAELQESGDVVSGGVTAVVADARRWLGQVIDDGQLAAALLADAPTAT